MTGQVPTSGLQLRSLVTAEGRLELSLQETPVAAPGPDEVVVRVQATPINPSDLGLLLGPADPAKMTRNGASVGAPLGDAGMRFVAARVGESLPVGNEGAGVVVAAGEGEAAQTLVGRTVAILGGAMYAQFRTLPARDCLPLPEGVTARQGASAFVNPLTTLGMVGTMRLEGHSALVHTAAASNLGQMLVRLCKAEGVPLVNIVRSAEQVKILKGLGAEHVVDSSQSDFSEKLLTAVEATGATLGFDATGGGRLAGQILTAMEIVASKKAGAYNRYGSTTHKQVYIYGRLDLSPTELSGNFGMSWGVGGWLLTYFLQRVGAAEAQALRERVAREITTTFASGYTHVISLSDVLDPATIEAYARKATGKKYLIDPSLG